MDACRSLDDLPLIQVRAAFQMPGLLVYHATNIQGAFGDGVILVINFLALALLGGQATLGMGFSALLLATPRHPACAKAEDFPFSPRTSWGGKLPSCGITSPSLYPLMGSPTSFAKGVETGSVTVADVLQSRFLLTTIQINQLLPYIDWYRHPEEPLSLPASYLVRRR